MTKLSDRARHYVERAASVAKILPTLSRTDGEQALRELDCLWSGLSEAEQVQVDEHLVLPWGVCEALWQVYRLVLAVARVPWRRWRAALRTWGLCDDPRCIRRGWRRPLLRPEDHRIGGWVCAGECERTVEELGE